MKEVKNEIIIENGREYNYIEYDKKFPDGTPWSDKTSIPTELELLKVDNDKRIEELRIEIYDKQLLGDDVTELQLEFRTLLGL